MKSQDVKPFSLLSKIMHWLIACIVIPMLALSFFLEDLPNTMQGTAFLIHKSLGLTVLLIMLFRLFWIHYRGRPALPPEMPGWERVFSRTVQYAFYFFLILMPMAGWILSTVSNHIPSYFGLFPLPFPGITANEHLANIMDDAHKIMAWILIGLLFLHVSGALKHHFWNKDQVLKRMWF